MRLHPTAMGERWAGAGERRGVAWQGSSVGCRLCRGNARACHAIRARRAARFRCSVLPMENKPRGLARHWHRHAVPRAAPVPAALCARAAAWGFFVRGAGQVPPPRLPTGPGSEQPPRSKSAAFAYSEQVGAHMPKMHQTKLATIIIIKCAVVLGEGRAWQTSLIIMKLSMCAAVLQQLCLAQQAGNDACYNHPPSPTRPPVARSREGCASLGASRAAVGKGARGRRGAAGKTPSRWVRPFASWFVVW